MVTCNEVSFRDGKDAYWDRRLREVRKALQTNNFDVYLAKDRNDAQRIVAEEILPSLDVRTVSTGGSMTVGSVGVLAGIKDNPKYEFISPYDSYDDPHEQRYETAKRSILVDLFVTGTNAVTEDGQLVNLDMFGNRITGINYGPKNTLILVGRNKIVPDIEAAFYRVRHVVSPLLTTWFGGDGGKRERPCGTTSRCVDCHAPDRICNVWSIVEKAYPKGRIKVVLINEDLGA
jgi:hypothetical protein